MDFLDPKKQKQHHISVLVGYVLVTIMIGLTTWLLFNQAGGFGLDKNGQVVQSGLLFVSSVPAGATIHLNNTLNPNRTNARLSVLGGQYTMRLSRTDYRDWQQTINLYGGSVEHYDYPFLFPKTLTTSDIRSQYTAAPLLASQSPDRRWLVVQPTATPSFELFDLKAAKPTPTVLTLPDDVASNGTVQSWKAVEWASDNRHLLLQHSYDSKTEYITLDRTAPEASINISKLIEDDSAEIKYSDSRYDHYFVYKPIAQTLATASVGAPQPVPLLEHVLSYKAYGSDTVLYASSQAVSSGKVAITMLQDGKSYLVREVPASSSYLLDFTRYSGTWYVVFGSTADNRVYIYKDPVGQIRANNNAAIASYVLKTANPSFVGFSSNARFIVDENASQFAVYDIETGRANSYNTNQPVTAPQTHAYWMDGFHLSYVNGSKLVVFDFDGANLQTLMSANPMYQPFFAADYKSVITLAPGTGSGAKLQTTSLRTPADQ